MIICFFYLRFASNIYQTSAKIKIIDNSDSAFKLPNQGVSIFSNTNEDSKGNEIIIMTSSRIIEKVVDSLNLTTEIHSLGRLKTTELWKEAPFFVVWAKEKNALSNESTSFEIALTKKGYTIKGNNKEYKFGETNFNTTVPFKLIIKNASLFQHSIGKEFQINLKTRNSVVNYISNSIIIDYVLKPSDILSVTLKGYNQDKINDIVNALIQIFNEDGIQDRQIVSKKTIEFIDNQFKFIFSDLDSIETTKANFKKEKKFSYITSDAGLLMANNSNSKSRLETTSTQLAITTLMMNSLSNSKGLELLPSNIGIDNVEINGLVSLYNEQILKRNKLLLSGGGESNPMVEESGNVAVQIKNNIKASIIGYQNVLKYNLNELSKVNDLDINEYSKVPFTEKGIHSIERQQTIKETLYILLLQKREEASINLAITNPTLKVVDYAIPTPNPIAPQRNIIFLGALILGLLLPIFVLYIYYLLDNKINNKEDVEELLPNIPVVAEIPHIESQNKIISFLDRSILSESFRILRNNINYINPVSDNGLGSVLFVTSTIKGEGKTFIALNLAVTLSTLGKKVILIGADLRNPQLHKELNLVRYNLSGVTNYLYDSTLKIDDIKTLHSIDSNLSFDIIFSGAIPPNPAELLSNGRFESLLNDIKKDYDYVIVDTAPTLLVADTTLITHLADTVLYVTRANFTEKKLFKFISNLKKLNGIKNMGIILNNVGQNKGYGYGYNYSYNYGYNYGYDNDSKKPKSMRKEFRKWLRKTIKKIRN
jgi:capsular exopolysaccharide synthesis family protein